MSEAPTVTRAQSAQRAHSGQSARSGQSGQSYRSGRSPAAGTTPGPELDEVAEHMTRVFEAHTAGWNHNPLVGTVGHSLASRAEMVRAEVFLAACRAVGADPRTLVPAAAGVEYGHLASLAHDHLIDDLNTRDPLRRDEPPVWCRGADAHAVVTGDWMLFAAVHALAMCADLAPAARVVAALRMLSEAGIEACFGAGLEITLGGDALVAPQTYLRMATARTGSVLRAAAASGALLGGGTPEQVAAAGTYGANLGIAVQLVDDLLPYTGDGAALGRPVQGDLRHRRPTLPVLYALETCADHELAVLRAALAAPAARRTDPDRGATRGAGRASGRASGGGTNHVPADAHGDVHRGGVEIAEILARTGALARTRQTAGRYQAASLAALAGLPDGAGREQLRSITTAVLDRDT